MIERDGFIVNVARIRARFYAVKVRRADTLLQVWSETLQGSHVEAVNRAGELLDLYIEREAEEKMK